METILRVRVKCQIVLRSIHLHLEVALHANGWENTVSMSKNRAIYKGFVLALKGYNSHIIVNKSQPPRQNTFCIQIQTCRITISFFFNRIRNVKIVKGLKIMFTTTTPQKTSLLTGMSLDNVTYTKKKYLLKNYSN